MDREKEQFQQDLLDSVRQMNAGKAARVTEGTLSPPVGMPDKVGDVYAPLN
jgi:putative transcriptional regulator